MNKKILVLALLVLILPAVGLLFKTFQLPSKSWITREIVADFSDDRLLVGFAENVFLATIGQRVSDRDMSGTPATQFSAQVLTNLKGDLSGEIVVSQVPEDDVIEIESDGSYRHPHPLQRGATYILATSYDTQRNQHTLLPHFNAHILVSNEPSIDAEQLNRMLLSSLRYAELNEALKHQITLEEYWARQRERGGG